MGRSKRVYTVGEFWLDKRPDGKSPFYQIAWYDERRRTTRYRSTGCERLADAKAALDKHFEAERAKGPQDVATAYAVPLLLLFWDEHGKSRINSAQVASSLRQFIGFLKQDKADITVTVQGLTPDVFTRFVRWRSGPHSYGLRWQGKDFNHSSPGVAGESIQRNLDDVRAALNHHVKEGRIPFAPKVASVETMRRSPPRDVRLTFAELGAIVGYCQGDEPMLRWVLGMLGTGARPDAVLKWDVAKQWDRTAGLLDTHPAGATRTKKRNAVVPVIPQLEPTLERWATDPHPVVKSRKTSWRTMRAALGLRDEVVPKVIRHTVATELRALGVPQLDVEGLLGHQMSNRVTAVYAKYDPERLSAAKQGLSTIWDRVAAEAVSWSADHLRTIGPKGTTLVIAREPAKC